VYVTENESFLAAVIPAVLVDLANKDRADNGLLALRVSDELEDAARLKAQHMAEEEYFAHTSPDGVTPWYWFIEAGYEFSAAGENLAVHYTDSEDVEDAWMDSPGHRANILNAGFTEIGIATAKGTFEGHDTIFVVQMFGRPARTAVVPDSVATNPNISDTDSQEPAIAGESTVTEADEETLEVLFDDSMFLAVEHVGEEGRSDTESVEVSVPKEELELSPQTDEDVAGTAAAGLVEPSSTWWQRMLSQPYQVLRWVYALIVIFVIVALLLMVFIEIEKQHFRHVFYGLLVLALVLTLLYVSRAFFFGELLIL
jgi:hypothetical protein